MFDQTKYETLIRKMIADAKDRAITDFEVSNDQSFVFASGTALRLYAQRKVREIWEEVKAKAFWEVNQKGNAEDIESMARWAVQYHAQQLTPLINELTGFLFNCQNASLEDDMYKNALDAVLTAIALIADPTIDADDANFEKLYSPFEKWIIKEYTKFRSEFGC